MVMLQEFSVVQRFMMLSNDTLDECKHRSSTIKQQVDFKLSNVWSVSGRLRRESTWNTNLSLFGESKAEMHIDQHT